MESIYFASLVIPSAGRVFAPRTGALKRGQKRERQTQENENATHKDER